MNGKQRLLIYAAVLAIVLMFVFPPFIGHGQHGIKVNKGYSFILSYPNEKTSISVVNTAMLLTQIAGVLVVTGLLFISLTDRDH